MRVLELQVRPEDLGKVIRRYGAHSRCPSDDSRRSGQELAQTRHSRNPRPFEARLMPAPEQKVVNCPCGAKLLLRWTWSMGSAIYPARCADCGAQHQLPPIEVYRIDSKGYWEYLTTIGSEPT